jgi:Flp pilus assembly protein TadG
LARLPAMLARSTPFSRLRDFVTRFRLARRGTAAVEFAMLALPFFGLLCGIIEIGMIFVVATTLDDATNTAARTIRTGQLQTAGGSSSNSFATSICGQLSWLGSNCASNLSVDVETFNQFSSITAPQTVTNGVFTPPTNYSIGGPGDIVVVRAYYQWALFTPLMNQAMQTISGGKMLITSTATFRNEPY